MNVNLKSLIEKLTPSARNALEAAAGLCVTRTHYDVEVEHYLMKLLDDGPGDFEKIRRRFGVDDSRLTADLTRSLDALKSGNARTPAFSPTIVKMLSAAWQVGSLEFGQEEIRTGSTILALVSDPELARMSREISKELSKIDAQALQKEFGAIVAGSPEDLETAVAAPGGGPASAAGAPRPDGKKSKLDQFTIDLTANARAGKIDAVLGRDREIRQVVDILMRRRQNNPSSPVRPASARPRSSRALPCASPPATFRLPCRTSPSARSISRSSRPAPVSKANSKTASKASSKRSSRRPLPSSCLSTRPTP